RRMAITCRDRTVDVAGWPAGPDFPLRRGGGHALNRFATLARPCGGTIMTTAAISAPPSRTAISSHEALRIARLDAEEAYGHLADFRIEILLERDGWHINYWLKDPNLNGGGPHYVIESNTGAIVSKKYFQ